MAAEGRCPIREEVTSEQLCDESRPSEADSLLIKLPRWAGQVPADRLVGGHVICEAPILGQRVYEPQPQDGTPSTYPASQSQTSHYQDSQRV